jgi:hypothetical protein
MLERRGPPVGYLINSSKAAGTTLKAALPPARVCMCAAVGPCAGRILLVTLYLKESDA